MDFLKRALVSMTAATLAVVVPGGPTIAHGYISAPMARGLSGSWPVTVTGSQRSNFTGCLTLNGSGFASLVINGSQKFPYGTYLVINHTFVATIQVQGYSQNASFLFIGRAEHKAIGPGVFEDAYGGEDFDSGALTFGMKGGC